MRSTCVLDSRQACVLLYAFRRIGKPIMGLRICMDILSVLLLVDLALMELRWQSQRPVLFAIDADGNNICVEREHASVLFSDPRRIIVRVCSKALDFYVPSAHAPFLGFYHRSQKMVGAFQD